VRSSPITRGENFRDGEGDAMLVCVARSRKLLLRCGTEGWRGPIRQKKSHRQTVQSSTPSDVHFLSLNPRIGKWSLVHNSSRAAIMPQSIERHKLSYCGVLRASSSPHRLKRVQCRVLTKGMESPWDQLLATLARALRLEVHLSDHRMAV